MDSRGPLTVRFRALLTMQGDPIENGELTVQDGVITSLSDLRKSASDNVLDLSDCLVLPGFVNAHCHLALSGLAGRVAKCALFTDWIRAVITQNQRLAWEDRVKAAREAASEMLRSGVTTLADYLSHPELIDNYHEFPFRQVLFLETLGFPESAMQETLERVEALLKKHSSLGNRFQLGIAPHAPYSVSAPLFKKLRGLANQYQCLFSSHLAEFDEEVRFLREGGGELQLLLEERGTSEEAWKPPALSPVRYLDSLGVLKEMAAVHLNYIDNDVDLVVSQCKGAVFCPGSTRWLGREKILPVRELLDRGLPVGLGTDSLASNESLNFLRELKIADEMLVQINRKEILMMATRGGAEALGQATGVLTPGRPADLIGFRVNGSPGDWWDVPFEPIQEQADIVMAGGQVVYRRDN